MPGPSGGRMCFEIMTRSKPFRASVMIVGAVALTVCGGANPAGPAPTVQFLIDAPLCSSRIPVELSIDSKLVAIDTFVVHLNPEHTTSASSRHRPGNTRLARVR